MRLSSALMAIAVSAIALVTFSGCDEDLAVCNPVCGAGFECGFDSSDQPRCLELCGGGLLCQDNQTCQNGECVVQAVTCPAGQHQVSGNCIENYTASNVCDPYFACRRLCGTSTACLDACRRDAPSSCTTRLDAIVACETRNNCSAASFNENCCTTEFCAAWVSNPNCGNVPACDVCAQAAGDSTPVFNQCVGQEPACNSCLQPFFDCGAGSDCQSLFCDCLSARYCN